MLYINDELVNTRNSSADYEHAEIVKDYHKTIKEMQDYYGEFVNIETSVRPRKDAKTRALRYPGPRGLLLQSTVNRDLGGGQVVTEHIRYSPVMLRRDDSGNYVHEDPNLLIHKGVFSFKIQDNPDLAYYVRKCGKVGMTPAEGKKFHFYDAKDIHSKNAQSRRMEGQVLNLIYSTLPENKLRTLAKSFGVGDVNLKDAESIREELYLKLTDAEDKKKRQPGTSIRGFKEFVSSSEVKIHDQVTAVCVDARSDDILIFNTDERRWEIDFKDGGSNYILKELSGNEFGDPMGSLVAYLLTETEKLRKLENAMGIAKVEDTPRESKPTISITAEQILTTNNVPTLRKWLKEIDPEFDIKKDAKAQSLKETLLSKIPTE